MKKKIIILSITAVVVACMVFMGFMVNAETIAAVGDVSSGRGEEVVFEVTLNESIKVKSGAVELKYDHTALKLIETEDAEVEIKTGWLISGTTLAQDYDPRTEKGAFAFTKDTTISGAIYRVTFEVLNDAKFETTAVECIIQLKNSSSNDNLPLTNVAGSLTVVCGHKYSSDYSHDGDGHWRVCEICGNSKADEGVHTGGSATCVKKAVCDVCKAEYGTVDSTKHGATEVRGAKDATCVDEGYTGDTYCKDCGAKIASGSVIAATGHKWDNGTVTKAATHIETGIMTYQCTVCGETKTEVIPKTTEHKFGKWASDGEKNHKRTCECGETETEAHKWDGGTVTKAATHTAEGVMTYQCTVCGETKTEVIPKTTEHKFGEWKSNGAEDHTRTCECGVTETVPHAWDKGSVTKAATHTETGIMTYQCTDCGETRTEVIPKTTEHNYGEWKSNGAEDHTRTCECGEAETAPHAWDNGTVTKAATHTETGIMTYTCTVCGETKTGIIPTTVEHKFGEWKSNGAEEHARTCECGEIETAPHAWDNGTETKAATHTEAGIMTYKCTDCGEIRTEVIPKTTEHNYGEWTSNGAEDHIHTCECGETETAPHTWDNGALTKKMTHTEDGEMTYTCIVCGETKTEAIAAVADHDWDDGVVTKSATHTEEGEITYTCGICGETRTEVIPVLEGHTFGDWQSDETNHWKECVCGEKDSVGEHTYGDWTVTKEATENEKGTKEHSCTVCGHAETEEIPVVEKTPESKPDTTPATKPDTTPATKPDTAPKTGDAAIAIVGIIVVAGMAVAVALYTKKRKNA